MLKCLGWLFLHYLKLALDSRSDSARTFNDRLKAIPPTEERREEVLASEYRPFVPCLHGCIGASPIGTKGKGPTATGGSEPWATTFCHGSEGDDNRKEPENETSGQPLRN